MEEIMNRQAKAWEKATNTLSIDNWAQHQRKYKKTRTIKFKKSSNRTKNRRYDKRVVKFLENGLMDRKHRIRKERNRKK